MKHCYWKRNSGRDSTLSDRQKLFAVLTLASTANTCSTADPDYRLPTMP